MRTRLARVPRPSGKRFLTCPTLAQNARARNAYRLPVLGYRPLKAARPPVAGVCFSGSAAEAGPELRQILEVASAGEDGRKMHLRPDPDFEDFARDCIRLANEEK